MDIVKVNKNNMKDFIKFSKDVYKGNLHYHDATSRTLKNILSGKAEICKSSFIEGLMAVRNDEIVAVCVFCIVDRMSDILQMSFFEAKENEKEAIESLIAYGKQIAKKNDIKKILAGLNIHVNYGLGFLANYYDSNQSLGSSYNPKYYLDYFKDIAVEELTLISYTSNMENLDFNLDNRVIDRILRKYKVRKADFKNIEKEAAIYTQVNNEAFKDHRFYYKRKVAEDLELFKEYKLFLKEENLLFLEYKGIPIGFMLWYPDFNQLLSENEEIGIKTLIKSRIFKMKIDKFKIVELGVIPKFQKTGAVFALFDYCKELTEGRYKICESGWILEDNLPSKSFGIRWADKQYKSYKVYLMDV